MSPTTNSIITAMPSTSVPTLNSMPPIVHQFSPQMVSTGSAPACFASLPSAAAATPRPREPRLFSLPWSPPCSSVVVPCAASAAFTWEIHWAPATSAQANTTDSAVMPISAPFFGRRLPNRMISRKDSAGMAGKIQAFRRNHPTFSAVTCTASTASAASIVFRHPFSRSAASRSMLVRFR